VAGDPDAGKVLWKHLAYKGKHFLGKVETDVSLVGLPADEVQCLLIPVPEGNALQVSSSHVIAISVQSAIDPLFGANDLTGSQAWFIPGDATALQRIRFRKGDDIWQNTYRFTEKGVYRLRQKPGRADEKKLAPKHWTKIKESFYPYPYNDKHSGYSGVLEPTGLLYLVSALDFMRQADPLSLYVFDRKQLHRVKAYVSGHQRLKVNYLEKTLQNEIRKEGMIDTVKISFEPEALVPKDTEPEEFSFLGLKGDFEIYIDSASRLPIQVTGNIKGSGKVSITLHEVGLVQ